MKILFLNPNLRVEKEFIDYPYFINLNMLQAVGFLKERGYELKVIDMFSQPDSNVVEQGETIFFGSQVDIKKIIRNTDFDLAIILNSPFLKLFCSEKNMYIQEIMEEIKLKKNIPKIVLADFHMGGMHFIDYDGENIKKKYPLLDEICKGECEKKVLNLLGGSSADFDSNLMRDLDSIPFPDYESISIDKYCSFLNKVSNKGYAHFLNMNNKTLPIFTSRGCIYDCSFCTSKLGERVYRKNSIEYIKNNLLLLKKNFEINKVIILDEMVNPTEKRINDLVILLNELDLKYEFPNGLRADALSKETLEKINGKVTLISISAESGVQQSLDSLFNKRLNLSSVSRVAKDCMNLHIPLQIHFMIGMDGEKIKDINGTFEFAIELYEKYGAIPLIQFAVPLPGSHFYANLSSKEGSKYFSSSKFKQYILDNYVSLFKKSPESDYSYWKNYEDIDSLMKNFNRRLKFQNLEKVILNVTYKCNNNCIFCAVGDWRNRVASFALQKKMLREAYLEKIRMVDFDGGEPTIEKNIFSLIKYAKQLGYKNIGLISNGRLFSIMRNAERFFESGINSLIISLHGPDKNTHDAITRVSGSFEQTLNGIKNVLCINERNKEKISFAVNITLTKKNILNLSDFFSLVCSLGVKRVNIQFITPFGFAKKKDLPSNTQIIKILPMILKNYSKKIDIKIINLPFCYLKGYEDYLVEDTYKSNRNMIFIGQKKENLAKFLLSKRYKDEDCSSCVYNIICSGKWDFRREKGGSFND